MNYDSNGKYDEILEILNPEDQQALIRLYQLRALSTEQLYHLFYPHYASHLAFIQEALYRLVSLQLVRIEAYHEGKYGVCLENHGVQVVRMLLDLPGNLFNESNKLIKRGYLRASDLRVLPRFMNHQIHLNQFVLAVEHHLKMKYPEKPYHYFDEKHLSRYLSIRPDGLIQFLGVDILLEMDMGTESRNILNQKWRHYRTYLKDGSQQIKEQKVIVFFICEEYQSLESRRELLIQTATENIGDFFNEHFEMYIGDTTYLLELLFKQLIPEWLHYRPMGQSLQQLLLEHSFNLFKASKFNLFLNRGYQQYFGIYTDEFQETYHFFVNDWRTYALTVATNLHFHQQNNSRLKHHYHKTIYQLIILNDLDEAKRLLKVLNLLGVHYLYFTTPELLLTNPFDTAIFWLNTEGQPIPFSRVLLK